MEWTPRSIMCHALAALLLGGCLTYLLFGRHKDWGLGLSLAAVIATRLLIVNAAGSRGSSGAADESDLTD